MTREQFKAKFPHASPDCIELNSGIAQNARALAELPMDMDGYCCAKCGHRGKTETFAYDGPRRGSDLRCPRCGAWDSFGLITLTPKRIRQ
jgi:DNA-directed RNA polymerase subunit RPC12/RpoP